MGRNVWAVTTTANLPPETFKPTGPAAMRGPPGNFKDTKQMLPTQTTAGCLPGAFSMASGHPGTFGIARGPPLTSVPPGAFSHPGGAYPPGTFHVGPAQTTATIAPPGTFVTGVQVPVGVDMGVLGGLPAAFVAQPPALTGPSTEFSDGPPRFLASPMLLPCKPPAPAVVQEASRGITKRHPCDFDASTVSLQSSRLAAPSSPKFVSSTLSLASAQSSPRNGSLVSAASPRAPMISRSVLLQGHVVSKASPMMIATGPPGLSPRASSPASAARGLSFALPESGFMRTDEQEETWHF